MGAKKHIPIVDYPGELGEPHVRVKAISGGLFSLLLGEKDQSAEGLEARATKANLDALGKKLVLLAEHYSAVTDDDDINWKQLAIELAFAHVPGFTTVEERPRKRGRPGRSYFDFALYEAVLGVLDEGEPSVANACRTLAKRRGAWKGKNPDTLETRFHEQRRRAAQMDLRPHLHNSDTGLAAALADISPAPSGKYPPVPFKGRGLFGIGARSLYDHEKS
ncbi:MAG: hypothetical protein IPK28_23200 [Devosia sp.]|nr:hypothetical protein [Devosia sp.]